MPLENEARLPQAEIMLALDNIEMAVRGYGSSEHGAGFREAVTLCRGLRNGHGPV
jgi:hypothetical protein